MLVMLAYDTPEQKNQNFLRKEFERMGGVRVQYSIYLYSGEPPASPDTKLPLEGRDQNQALFTPGR